MKQQRKRIRKCIAILMTLAMVLSMGTGITLPRQAQAAGYGLSNPVTDSNGVTTWDCVYFGNYYQSDATGNTKDPIKWRVLSVDGDDAFLMADQNLDAKPYNTSYVDVTWETCTLRSWLNGYGASANVEETDYSSDNFLDTAFTAEERAAIRQTTVVRAAMIPRIGYICCLLQRRVMHPMDLIAHLIRIAKPVYQRIQHILQEKVECILSAQPPIGGCVRRAAVVMVPRKSGTTATASTATVMSTF